MEPLCTQGVTKDYTKDTQGITEGYTKGTIRQTDLDLDLDPDLDLDLDSDKTLAIKNSETEQIKIVGDDSSSKSTPGTVEPKRRKPVVPPAEYQAKVLIAEIQADGIARGPALGFEPCTDGINRIPEVRVKHGYTIKNADGIWSKAATASQTCDSKETL